VMGLIGEQFLSAFWIGIRGATTKRDDEEDFELVQYDHEVLAAKAKEVQKLFSMPKWKRRFYRWWDATRRRVIKFLEKK
jgi:hypothetical protein